MDRVQSEVFEFLAQPQSWPSRPERVDIIETHGARVFLAGEDVLKVKRAVRLPYLDFSSLAARRQFCEREIALNKSGPESLYRDVVPIVRREDGRLAIAGEGTIVEWAVRMHRFAQEDLLTNVVTRGEMTRALAEDLADVIYRYHAAAPIAPAPAESMARVCDNVLAGLSPHLEADLAARLTGLITRGLDDPLRSKRAAAGYVRRCHGDLHLGNIVLWRGRPVLFDALEFDETLATTDTLYDLAFVLMDLDRHGARDAANALLNRYLWRSRDLIDVEGLALLPLFLIVRAAIRAMVLFDRPAKNPADAHQQQAQAVQLLESALRDVGDRATGAESGSPSGPETTPTPPLLIAIGGLSGTGKTTLARALAPWIGAAPGALHLRSDMERKALAGVEPTTRLPPEAYTKSASSAVYALLWERALTALTAGHSVILDAVFADPTERAGAEKVAHKAGVKLHGFWLEAPSTLMAERISTRRGDASDATTDVLTQQMAYHLGTISWPHLDSSRDISDSVNEVMTRLNLPPVSR